MKKLLSVVLLTLAVLTARAQKSEIFCTDDGALRGYDVVAFFIVHKPVPGKQEITSTWNKAVWHFSSTENKKAFDVNPLKYVPQYGGYCAYGTSEGHKAPTQPETWTIVNNKLYFNYNMDVKKGWTANQKALIEKADKNWPTVKDSE